MNEKTSPAPLDQKRCRAKRTFPSGESSLTNTRSGNPPQGLSLPIVLTRIVVGARYTFYYVERCPLCDCEHGHGAFLHHPRMWDRDDRRSPLWAYRVGYNYRAAHCYCIAGVERSLDDCTGFAAQYHAHNRLRPA
jgi:hypothetical protein